MFQELLDKLTRREDLTSDEAAAAMAEIMAGRASEAQIAGFLVGLVMKGERPAEIVGLARTMRANAVPLKTSRANVFDTCGTGRDRSGTFNISSCAAIVVAACGVTVLVHDQRAILTICARVNAVPDCDDVTLALPHLVGGDGVLATIPLALDDTERVGLRRSAGILRDAVRSLQLDV